MLPLKKVMSRFPHLVHNDQFLLSSKNYPTGVKDSSAFVIHGSNNDNSNVQQSISFGGFVIDNNITSPISKINFSQASVEQVKFFLHLCTMRLLICPCMLESVVYVGTFSQIKILIIFLIGCVCISDASRRYSKKE
jgi:hypothetical protein